MPMPTKPARLKHKTLAITMPPALAVAIDEAKPEGMTRSAFIAGIISKHIKFKAKKD